MKRFFAGVLALGIFGAISYHRDVPALHPIEAFRPTKSPVSPDGVRAICDLPTDQHMRNTGGWGPWGPGTGAGLCVFTSVEVSGRWQNVRELDGLQKWMTKRAGGGTPSKLAAMLKQYCAEKGTAVPHYVQHTGGDLAFLDLAIKTRRMPAVTYAGFDDYYGEGIDHMVNLPHLDPTRGCIIDNNRPGQFVWMTRKEFAERWRARAGGWAVVLLAPPPPPSAGQEPAPVPVPSPDPDAEPSPKSPRRPHRRPIFPLINPDPNAPPLIQPEPTPPSPRCPNCPIGEAGKAGETSGKGCDCCKPTCTCKPGQKDKDCVCYPCRCNPPAGRGEAPEPIGTPPTPDHEWGPIPGHGWGWRLKPNYGVEPGIPADRPRYWIDGEEVTREQAYSAVGDGLVDDSDKFSLSIIAPDDSIGSLQTALADPRVAAMTSRCHVQIYGPDSWVVKSQRLTARMSLHAPASKGAKLVATGEGLSLDDLLNLLRPFLDPNWRPAPTPAPEPHPAPAPAPVPAPGPGPSPSPCPCNPTPDNPTPCGPQPNTLVSMIALLVAWLTKRKD